MKQSKRPSGTLRIIGGRYRSRIIHFDPDIGVRPTTDRIRETLFNWLAPQLHQSHCVDLFAGSGALGFEAVSRGAATVLMCDASHKAIAHIKGNIQNLDLQDQCIPRLQRFSADMPPLVDDAVDVIFLDPPFEQGLLLPTIAWCYSTGMADDNTVISFEAEKYLDLEPEALPEGVQILKHKKTKHIQYGLIGCA